MVVFFSKKQLNLFCLVVLVNEMYSKIASGKLTAFGSLESDGHDFYIKQTSVNKVLPISLQQRKRHKNFEKRSK